MNVIKKSEDLKLRIELVPSTSWYDNLRNRTDKDDWDRIRKKTYKSYGYKCGVCNAEGKLDCHEVWEYDDTSHIQKLKGFIPLCDMCHHVKHIGLAGILANKGELNYEKVVEHFMKINNCTRAGFEKHLDNALKQWKKRSTHKWQINLGDYEEMIEMEVHKSGSKGD